LNDQQQEQGEHQQQGAALPPQLVVHQVLVRFTPEEQRWQQRQVAPEQREEDEDGGERLSQEQLEELGGLGGTKAGATGWRALRAGVQDSLAAQQGAGVAWAVPAATLLADRVLSPAVQPPARRCD
jgi:hypothetical protein